MKPNHPLLGSACTVNLYPNPTAPLVPLYPNSSVENSVAAKSHLPARTRAPGGGPARGPCAGCDPPPSACAAAAAAPRRTRSRRRPPPGGGRHTTKVRLGLGLSALPPSACTLSVALTDARHSALGAAQRRYRQNILKQLIHAPLTGGLLTGRATPPLRPSAALTHALAHSLSLAEG
jgi:hypothetical protein